MTTPTEATGASPPSPAGEGSKPMVDTWQGLSYSRFAGRGFDQLTHRHRRRVFGVDYREFRFRDGGRLFLTRHGWPLARLLEPSRWYANKAYCARGRRLPYSTGTVYSLDVGQVAGRNCRVVVKFSRFAQHIAADLSTTFREETPPEAIAKASFNSPFVEFARVYALRDAHHHTGRRRTLTKRPLAIYEVPENEPAWRLGRDACAFSLEASIQKMDQDDLAVPPEERVELARERGYVLLFGWVEGSDAATLATHGALGEDEMHALVRETEDELRFQGFGVLDHKAHHVILRQRRNGTLVRRKDGKLVYALIDFELLLPLSTTDPEQERQRIHRRIRSLIPSCPYFICAAPQCQFASWRRETTDVEARLASSSLDNLAALLRSHRECYRQRKTALNRPPTRR
jgi:hypothetical protein